ncbi:hypothetical protein TIFTF001_016710 [Ficus carica]|uniref:Uncharacterized protein n=1 Tax=Ficus carica TaxID=3494 RepID=A0AA88DIW4_FICCA|nr:hypothetical protein TIFTF001_016710 [Ficus carica]
MQGKALETRDNTLVTQGKAFEVISRRKQHSSDTRLGSGGNLNASMTHRDKALEIKYTTLRIANSEIMDETLVTPMDKTLKKNKCLRVLRRTLNVMDETLVTLMDKAL